MTWLRVLLRLILRADDGLTLLLGVVVMWRGLHMVAEPLAWVVVGALLVYLALWRRPSPQKET